MFVKKAKRAGGRTFLTIVKPYREVGTKKNKHKQIMRLGYLDELEKEFEDPMAHFQELAKQMTLEEKKADKLKLTFELNKRLSINDDNLWNIGFSVISKIYHTLEIHKFFINRESVIKAKYPLNNIMKLLVYERILHPSSKLSSYESRKKYFENFNFPLESMYRSFKYFAKYKNDLILSLHKNVCNNFGRDTSNVFYDVTNYYFDINEEDELRKKGMGKDKKGKPIVQMGLLLDKAGIPMTYELFSGNTNDFSTLLPVLDKVKKTFKLNKIIVVADKGLNSGSNKAYNIIKGDGYIFSRSVRGTKADNEVKRYVLNEEGYKWLNNDYKIKSRIYPTNIIVENIHGKKVKVPIDEKQIIFYSEKYARRTKYLRDKILKKAYKLISSPSIYAKADSYGALKYIKGMKIDKETGIIKEAKKGIIPVINEELILEEEKFDGYYSIVTSELDMPDNEVIEAYKGLWKIEESFKVTKTILKTRPAYVREEESLEAHFLSCFLSLLILRIIENKIGKKYSTEKIVESLKKSNVSLLEMNMYQAIYYDEVLEILDKTFGTALDKKYLRLEEIKKIISSTK